MLITIIFIAGYLLIVMEQPLRLDKTAVALLTGVACWVGYVLITDDGSRVSVQLYEHLAGIAGILFFLLGAMVIVELIDLQNGFAVITALIRTVNERRLLWIVSFVTFFMSALLDNLTATIIMISMLRKLVPDTPRRMMFAGMVVIAANAGGAWTPIGDVTTTMLWIGGQISALNIMVKLFLPSLVCMLVPLLFLSSKIERKNATVVDRTVTNSAEQKLIFFTGCAALVLVPVFKSITGLPPFMGMLFSLAVLWIVIEIRNRNKPEEERDSYSAVNALRRIDAPTILFFLGILVAVAALDATHQLAGLANFLDKNIQNINLVALGIGLLSSVVDNVPIVAATMGMYDMSTYPTDHYFWELIAYAAGTGGSCLIFGSAAGVAAMGMEKISFGWYLKKFSLIALAGYLAGAVVYIGAHYLI